MTDADPNHPNSTLTSRRTPLPPLHAPPPPSPFPLTTPRRLVLAFSIAAVIAIGATDGFGLDEHSAGVGLRQVAMIAVAAMIGWQAVRRRHATPAPPALRARTIVGLAIVAGAALGVLDAAHQMLRLHRYGVLVRDPWLLSWMTPVTTTLLFAAFGVLLALAGRLRLAPTSLRGTIAALGFLGAWILLGPHTELHDLAVLLLCAGVATVLARAADAQPRLLVRTLGLAGAAAAILAVAGSLLLRPHEQGPIAAAPPAHTPNVLLIVLDTVFADHVGCYGYPRNTTPNLDALAARGVRFAHAYAPAPWTLPSHVGIFTGRFPVEEPVAADVPLSPDPPTLAERLAQAGFATGGFIGNVPYCARAWGIGRGFQHYFDLRIAPDVALLSSTLGMDLVSAVIPTRHEELLRNHAGTVTDRFLDWSATVRGRPWFTFINYFDAHALYLPPQPWISKFGPRAPWLEQYYLREDWSAAERQGLVDAYDGGIAYIDAQIGRLLETLEQRGELARTLVVVTADHGEQFGEHDLWGHANSLYRSLLHVPLLVAGPGMPNGTTVEPPVSLNDLPATLCDLAGATPHPFPGTSLAPLWHGDDVATTLPLSQADTGISLFTRKLHWILYGGAEQDLFDLRDDPDELHDLSAQPGSAAIITDLRSRVGRFWADRTAAR